MNRLSNAFLVAAITLLTSAVASLAEEGTQPQVAIITGEFQNPRSREIGIQYDSALSPARTTSRIVLDEQNRFSLSVPTAWGTLVIGRYESGFPSLWQLLKFMVFDERELFFFYVEPGDSLHFVVEEGFFGSSYSFSGPGADNNRFVVEWMSEFGPFSLDYKALEIADFKHQIDQRRQDQFEFLAEGREEYALTPGFVDYATAFIKYEWAQRMVSYPRHYYRANGRENKAIVPAYYDFLLDIPLADEKAIGTKDYDTFVDLTLDWFTKMEEEDRKEHKSPAMSKLLKLSQYGLSDSAQARFDSIYEKNNVPILGLSQLIDLSRYGLSDSLQARLDSSYEKAEKPKLSEQFDLSRLGASQAKQALLDSLFAQTRSYRSTYPNEDAPRVDTTDGKVVFRLAKEGQLEEFAKTRKLSEKIDMSRFSLSDSLQIQLDSSYANHKPRKLSDIVNLAQFDLSATAQAQLDSLFAEPLSWTTWDFARRYDQAKKSMEGRVLYWYLAGQVIKGFEGGSEEFESACEKWEDFKKINPHPEYTESVAAALHKALRLRPGQPAPDFTLSDLDGQPVSLSQFKEKAVFLDFWASWCGPCISNLAFLRQIKAQMTDQQVVFLNISLDESDSAWRKAVAEHGIKGVHVRAHGWGSEVAKSYNVTNLPEYYIVDAQRLIAERLSAVHDTDEIAATLKKSL